MGRLVETAHAKINLALDVGEVRPDGYHEIHSVMQSLELRDIVELEDRPAGISIQCLPGHPTKQGALCFAGCHLDPMPSSDPQNLAWQAAARLIDATGVHRGLQITIRKAIPLSSGLAGGSADAAAVLRGLNHLWSLGLGLEELMAIGAKIGADVPFCLLQGTAEVRGIGEILTPLQALPSWPVILLKPPLAVSTAACYEGYDKLPHPVRVDVDTLVGVLSEEDLEKVAGHMGNSLEAVTLQTSPDLLHWKKTMEKAGPLGVLMSGSGPTLFGLVRDEGHGHEVFAQLVSVIKQERQRPLPNLYFTRLWADKQCETVRRRRNW